MALPYAPAVYALPAFLAAQQFAFAADEPTPDSDSGEEEEEPPQLSVEFSAAAERPPPPAAAASASAGVQAGGCFASPHSAGLLASPPQLAAGETEQLELDLLVAASIQQYSQVLGAALIIMGAVLLCPDWLRAYCTGRDGTRACLGSSR